MTIKATREELYDLYWNQELSTRDIAKIYNVGQTSIRRWLEKYNINTRTSKEGKQTSVCQEKLNKLADRYKVEYQKRILKLCPICGCVFIVNGAKKHKKYCSQECVKKAAVNLAKEKNPQLYEIQYCKRCGKSIEGSDRLRYKRTYCDDCVITGRAESQSNRITTTCGYCGKEIEVIPSRLKDNKYCYCNVDCMSKHYRILYTGENSPTWKGGKPDHYEGHWYLQRDLCRERDNYVCQLCGKTEEDNKKELSVHHIRPYRLFEDKEEANNLNNLISLCIECHSFVHSNNNTENIFLDLSESK